MKTITLCLLALLFCFAGCKKNEAVEDLAFVKVEFTRKTDYVTYMKYDGIKNDLSLRSYIAVPIGDRRFEVHNNTTGEKLIDTVLNITRAVTYYIYQAPGATSPVLQTEVPPVPPVIIPVDPNNPLENEPAAPEGFMKIKVANMAISAFPYPAMDIVFNSFANNPETGKEELTPLFTIKDVGHDFNSQFQIIQRPVIDGIPVTSFKLSFVDPATGELIRSVDGNILKNTSRATGLKVSEFNNFMISIKEVLLNAPQDNAVKGEFEYYVISPSITFQK